MRLALIPSLNHNCVTLAAAISLTFHIPDLLYLKVWMEESKVLPQFQPRHYDPYYRANEHIIREHRVYKPAIHI
jgi:hypothetical protein